jgi:Circularly permutated YpsA SLOG family
MSTGYLMTLSKIVSGGQAGIDRGTLDAVLAAGFPCGGWCPAECRAEDGPIPQRYPLMPLSGAGYGQRTRQNVIDSDGTAILFMNHSAAEQGLRGMCVCGRRNRLSCWMPN